MSELSPELLTFLDTKLTDLTRLVARTRRALEMLQDRAETDASLLAMVGTAAAAVRQQETILADIQQRVDATQQTSTGRRDGAPAAATGRERGEVVWQPNVNRRPE